jgi:hypothetical protein
MQSKADTAQSSGTSLWLHHLPLCGHYVPVVSRNRLNRQHTLHQTTRGTRAFQAFVYGCHRKLWRSGVSAWQRHLQMRGQETHVCDHLPAACCLLRAGLSSVHVDVSDIRKRLSADD